MKSTIYFTCLSFVILTFASSWKLKQQMSAEELGKNLFFDPILSRDSSVSCSSCHNPTLGFADSLAFSNGVAGKKTARNTPSILNLKNHDLFFWDGRAKTLAEQALMPIQNPDEMNLTIPEAIQRLNSHPKYAQWFKEVFKVQANPENLGLALEAYENTLETDETRMDKFVRGDSSALTLSEKRGLELFNGKANCINCHFGPDFTRDLFKNIGLYNAKDLSDKGRSEITKDKKDIGKFKVPGLRNVSETAPYMHNGMFKTLEDVVEYYNDPSKVVPNAINRDKDIQALKLSAQEKSDLVALLKCLTVGK